MSPLNALRSLIALMICLTPTYASAGLFDEDGLVDTLLPETCTYTVSGRLLVRHQLGKLVDIFGETSPLAGVQVRVSTERLSSLGWTGYTRWSVVRTDSEGYFSASRTTICDERRPRIEVKFDDHDMEIRHETSTSSIVKVKWYTVMIDDKIIGAGESLYDGLVFEEGAPLALGDFEPRRHADIWVLYHQIAEYMAMYSYPFRSKIKIKYPHDGITADGPEESYANPLNGVIYIVKNDRQDDGRSINTMIHELMHIWLYDYSQNEHRMSTYLATHREEGTHGITERAFVAFHEGFAEHAAQHLEHAMLHTQMALPLSRATLSSRGMGSLHYLQHKDKGWQTIFRMVALPNLHRYDLGADEHYIQRREDMLPKQCPEIAQIDFYRLLMIIAGGFEDDDLDYIDTDEMDLAHVFDRAITLFEDFTDEDEELYRQVLDPESDYEPYHDLCAPFGGGPFLEGVPF